MAIMTNRPLGAGFRATSVLADIVGRIAAWNDARVTRKALSASLRIVNLTIWA
jgi:hypothetical protein